MRQADGKPDYFLVLVIITVFLVTSASTPGKNYKRT